MPNQESKTLTKAEVVDSLLNTIGLTRREAKDIVDELLKALTNHLVEGRMVKLPGFGNFVVRSKRARPGRNPRTGEDVVITARKVVVFRPGQKLKRLIDDSSGD